MRTLKTFVTGIIKKPPFLFPWIAGFHIVMAAYTIWLFHDSPLSSKLWLQPAWLLGYTITWLFVCDMKKWAAFVYIAITSSDLLIFYFDHKEAVGYSSSFSLIAIVFCFLVLFFFKRFE